MLIATRTIGQVTVVELDGKLTIKERDSDLRQAISDLLATGARRLIIDLHDVRQLSSSGLGELVRIKVTANMQEVEVKLLGLSERVRQLLELTQVDGIFEIFEDEGEAIASFDAAPQI